MNQAINDKEILKNLAKTCGGVKELAAELGVHRQTLWEWGSDGLTARGRVLINNAAKRLQFWLPPDFMERKCR
jgi:hypothetical protein